MNKKKIYQIWPSKNQFFFKKYMTGPKSDIPSNYIPIVCVIGLTIYYSFTILPIIWESLSILVVSSFTLFIINIILIMVTTFTDPGIIPRRPFLLYKRANLKFQNKNDYILQKTLEYFLYQSEDPQKTLCPTCLIYRPKRASHCRDCDNCVLIHDHHCPFLHNCIGARNYKYFILCLISSICSTILFCFSFLQSFLVQSGNHNQSNTIQIFGIIIAGILGLIVVVFFIFHFYLICKGVTTRQMIKSRKKSIQQITKQIDNRIELLLHSGTMQISQKLNKLTFFEVQQSLIDFFQSIPENVSQKIQLQLQQNKIISKRIFQTGQQPIYLKHIKQEVFSELEVENNSILRQQQFDKSNFQ